IVKELIPLPTGRLDRHFATQQRQNRALPGTPGPVDQKHMYCLCYRILKFGVNTESNFIFLDQGPKCEDCAEDLFSCTYGQVDQVTPSIQKNRDACHPSWHKSGAIREA